MPPPASVAHGHTDAFPLPATGGLPVGGPGTGLRMIAPAGTTTAPSGPAPPPTPTLPPALPLTLAPPGHYRDERHNRDYHGSRNHVDGTRPRTSASMGPMVNYRAFGHPPSMTSSDSASVPPPSRYISDGMSITSTGSNKRKKLEATSGIADRSYFQEDFVTGPLNEEVSPF